MKFSVLHSCCFLLIYIGQTVYGRPQPVVGYQLANKSDNRSNSSIDDTPALYNDRPKALVVDGAIERRAGRGRPGQRQPSSGSRDGESPVRSRPATPESGSSGSVDSPLKNKAKGKERAKSRPPTSDGSRSPDRGKPKAAEEQPPAEEKPLELYLGRCGSRELGKLLVKAGASSSQSRPKTPPQRPHRSARPDKPLVARVNRATRKKGKVTTPKLAGGTKKLAVCPAGGAKGRGKSSTKFQVKLVFPNYPTSGTVIKSSDLKNKIRAFNAKDPDPCSDNYDFGLRPPPTHINMDQEKKLWMPDGKSGLSRKKSSATEDLWTTEHVLEGQIIQSFFLDYFERKSNIVKAIAKHITEGPFPINWRMNDKEQNFLNPDSSNKCQYLHQFWQDRFMKRDGVDVPEANAMSHLLEVFPGQNNDYINEFTLLPQRLNSKKELLFSSKGSGKKVVSPEVFKKYSFHAKIDSLREIVLLQKVSTGSIF